MSNQLNYNGQLISADDYLAKAQTLPVNTSADGNGGSMNIGNTEGAIEVVGVVNSEISITDTKVVTVKIQHADDTSFADLATPYSKTASGATTLTVGTELFRYILPTSTKKNVKAVLTTNDTGAAGKVDIYLNYLPR